MERMRFGQLCFTAPILFALGCGSDRDRDDSSSSGTSPSGWAGVYSASWSSHGVFSSPATWPPADYTDTGVITVTDLPDQKIQMSWQVGANTPSGTIIFIISGDSATASEGIGVDGTPWMGTLTNGAVQSTWCDVCTAQLVGNALTQSQSGHFTGTYMGTPYTGTYQGAWTGSRP